MGLTVRDKKGKAWYLQKCFRPEAVKRIASIAMTSETGQEVAFDLEEAGKLAKFIQEYIREF